MERDDYGLIDSGIPPEIVAKLLGNRERKKVAEAILSQSMKPVENMGGPGAKISWTQGLAQMLDAYQGGKGMREADANRQAIADEIARGQQASLARYKQTAEGTPGGPMVMDDFEGAPAQTVGVPGDRRRAIVDAFMDPYMKNSPLPKMDLADLNRDEEKKAQQEFLAAQAKQAQTERAFQAEENRKQRMAELEMRLADARLAREDRASLAQQLAEMRAESMRFAASLKQDPNRPRLKPGERYDEATGTVVPIEGSDLYRGQADKHAKDLSSVTGVETKTGQALKKIDEIIGPDPENPKPADGFKNLFGGYPAYATRLLPGETQAVAAKIESLKSDLKSAGLELMRTGGSIGQMTQQEWPIVQDMIARIDPRMPEKDAIAAFQQVRAYMNRIRDNAQGIYKTEWGDSVFTKKKAAGSPAAASPGTVLKFDASGNPVQ